MDLVLFPCYCAIVQKMQAKGDCFKREQVKEKKGDTASFPSVSLSSSSLESRHGVDTT